MYEIINRQKFNTWLSTPLGRNLCRLQSQWLAQLLATNYLKQEVVFFGNEHYILEDVLAEPVLVKSHITVLKTSNHGFGSLITNYLALPLLDESVDIVIMPHILDSYLLPLDIMREVYRILKPEGRVYLTYFNSISFWGLYQAIAKIFTQIPWRCRFLNFLQLEDWLGDLGFDIISCKSVGYCLPLNFEKLITWQSIIDKIIPLGVPFGAAQLLEVRKRVINLTLRSPLIVPKLSRQVGVVS